MRWLKRLLILSCTVVVAVLALFWWLTDSDALVPSKPGLLFSDLKRAQSLAETYRPSQLVAGERYVVSLSARELNLLATSAATAISYGHYANIKLLVEEDQMTAQVSLPILRNTIGRWLNLTATFRVVPGELPKQRHLTLGDWQLPQWINQQLEDRWQTNLPSEWVRLWRAAQVKLSVLDARILVGFTWIPETNMLLSDFYLPDDATNQATAKRVITALTDIVGVDKTPMKLNQFLAALLAQVMPTPEELPVVMVALAQYISGNPIGPMYAVNELTPPVISLTLSGRRDLARHYLISATLASQTGDNIAGQLGYLKELSDADNRSSGFSASDLLANQGGILFFHRLKVAVDSRQLPRLIRDLDQDLLPSKSALTVLETDWDKEDIAELMSVFVALPFYQIPIEKGRRR